MTRRTWRKFPSGHGWNHPTTPGWLGYTIALRAAVVVVLAWTLWSGWPS